VNVPVVLIDGSRLVERMIDHGVAVSEVDTVRLVWVDTDYLDED
jgi:restriction endonuclease Mrr